MCQVSAVIQIHAHNGISRLADCKLHSHVSLCARMRLDIRIFTAEKLLRPLDCKVFHHIHALTAAIVSLAGIAFGILVRQRASHRRHDSLAHPVFGSNQLDMAVLPLLLIHNRLCNFRICCPYIIQRIHFQSSLFTLYCIKIYPFDYSIQNAD